MKTKNLYWLYSFEDNWADEMDVEGFAPLTNEQKIDVEKKIAEEFNGGGMISFGTNEDNEYSSLEEVLEHVEFRKISKEEYDMIKSIFGDDFGQLGPLNDIERI